MNAQSKEGKKINTSLGEWWRFKTPRNWVRRNWLV